MPRQAFRQASSTASHDPATTTAGIRTPLSAQDSEPRDWNELGRRVLAEALRRATDELVRRDGSKPASVVPSFPAEGWS